MDSTKILALLFDEDDFIGLKRDKRHGSSASQPFVNAIKDIDSGQYEAVHIHPFVKIEDYDEKLGPDGDIQIEYHVTHNCKADTITKFRSFLVELDPNPAEWESYSEELRCEIIRQQQQFFKKIGLPITASVHSGNKSIHNIIVLAEPISIDQWRQIQADLTSSIETKLKSAAWNNLRRTCAVDVPSYTVGFRLPGIVRSDTGKIQSLIYVGNRIENSALDEWLQTNRGMHKVSSSSAKKERITFTFGGQDKSAYLKPGLFEIAKHGFSGSNPSTAASRMAGSLAYQGFIYEELIEIIDDKFPGISISETEKIVEDSIAWASKARGQKGNS